MQMIIGSRRAYMCDSSSYFPSSVLDTFFGVQRRHGGASHLLVPKGVNGGKLMASAISQTQARGAHAKNTNIVLQRLPPPPYRSSRLVPTLPPTPRHTQCSLGPNDVLYDGWMVSNPENLLIFAAGEKKKHDDESCRNDCFDENYCTQS